MSYNSLCTSHSATSVLNVAFPHFHINWYILDSLLDTSDFIKTALSFNISTSAYTKCTGIGNQFKYLLLIKSIKGKTGK
jgi:hypothetical protein